MSQRAEELQRAWNAQTFCLLTLTLIALGAALYFLRPVLVPFVLALFLTNCLIPVIDVQMRYLRMPRLAAIASTIFLAIIIVTLVGSLMITSVGAASTRLADYKEQFQNFPQKLGESLSFERWGIRVNIEEIAKYFSIQEGSGWQFMSSVLSEATNLLSNGLIVVIFMAFLLLGARAGGQRSTGMLGEIEANVQKYLVTTILLSVILGMITGVTLAILGVELAWIFGFLAFLLNFVPNVGAIIATLLPLPVILLSPEMSFTAKVLAIAIPAVVHFLYGNLIEPKFQGDVLDLHPVAVLLALMFFGMIWGMIGALLAAPMTAVARIICERVPILQPLADVLAGNLAVLSTGKSPTEAAEHHRLA